MGQLFRLGKGERTGEDQALPEMCKQVEEQDAPSQRRRPNRSKMRKIQASSRLISSTVACGIFVSESMRPSLDSQATA